MNYKIVKDKSRLGIFNVYKDYYFPFASITFEMDITKLLEYTKENKLKFWHYLLFFIMQSCNNVKEFKYRIVDDQIVKYDKVGVSFTFLDANNKLTFRPLNYTKSIAVFLREIKKLCLLPTSKLKTDQLLKRLDLIYTSSIPWISHTSLMAPLKNNSFSIPQINFGKYFNRDNRTLLPISFFTHHGLMDGYHFHLLHEEIQTSISDFVTSYEK